MALVNCQLPVSPSNSDNRSPEDFINNLAVDPIDPYFEALHYYQGENIKEYERLKEILARLSPRDYLDDWDKLGFHKAFDDSASSSS